MRERALILLSGGLDSVTALGWAVQQGYDIVEGVSFTYRQRHVREIEAARMVAAHFGIPHSLVELPEIEGSGLTGEAAIPQGRDISQLVEELAPTYVPNRNMIMIAHVASRAMNRAAEHLIGGWNRADARNYPDCRNDFLAAVEIALRLGTLVDFRIVRPLIQKDKAAIVKLATELGAPVEFTWTCYLGHDIACGDCDACLIRIGGFKAVGLVDPIEYDREIDWSGCLQIGRSTR